MRYYNHSVDHLRDNHLEDSLSNIRRCLELMLDEYFMIFNIESMENQNMMDKINVLADGHFISKDSVTHFHRLRKLGNMGVHADIDSIKAHDVKQVVNLLYKELDILCKLINIKVGRR